MKISSIELENVKGFKILKGINFSPKINILIGPNNSGKSTILNSIFILQRKGLFNSGNITIAEKNGKIILNFEGTHPHLISKKVQIKYIEYHLNNPNLSFIPTSGGRFNLETFPDIEPNNLIYPFLSKRKINNYSEIIDENSVNSVTGDFKNLYSKIDKLINPELKLEYEMYSKACDEILGFRMSTKTIRQGKTAVQYINSEDIIPMTEMGEGIPNILGLIVNLCISKNKIFLIEELENDIHPRALKGLLNLIISKADINQFFISTHSNIVMRILGANSDSKIFKFSQFNSKSLPNLKLCSMNEVSNDPLERMEVLEDLGYDVHDFGMWGAWLFLEESSAEVIIREYLIDWFVPSLKNKLRTYSAGSLDKIETKFEDFNNLFVFLHLEPTYKNKVWVYIDGGNRENEIITKMKELYVKSGWNSNNFNQFKEHDFEKYYPKRFQNEVDSVLKEDKQQKRKSKKELLLKVIEWIKNDNEIAISEFEQSASEIITILEGIQVELNTK